MLVDANKKRLFHQQVTVLRLEQDRMDTVTLTFLMIQTLTQAQMWHKCAQQKKTTSKPTLITI